MLTASCKTCPMSVSDVWKSLIDVQAIEYCAHSTGVALLETLSSSLCFSFIVSLDGSECTKVGAVNASPTFRCQTPNPDQTAVE